MKSKKVIRIELTDDDCTALIKEIEDLFTELVVNRGHIDDKYNALFGLKDEIVRARTE